MSYLYFSVTFLGIMDQEAVDGSDYMSNSDMNGLVKSSFLTT